MALAYRDFPFPLNVFMHVLTLEEGAVHSMHYGLFEREDESIAAAQERSTALLVERLPRPPCRLLEVGIGLGTTLARLSRLGYDVEGITPDERQIAVARSRFGDALPVHAASFESFQTASRYEAILFQESSQYIDSGELFRKARTLAAPGARVVVLDEFAIRPVAMPGALHRLDLFLGSAESQGFRREEEIDLSRQAAPTIRYFLDRLPRHRAALVADLGLSPEQLDSLIESGAVYADLYRSGAYGYRLLRFRA
jgi:cyclopropane fatty-acyl-phospholipid synthase-like methyltransferase